jgi:DeoR/GlpR family transcriptional regulator of sugar metabolism
MPVTRSNSRQRLLHLLEKQALVGKSEIAEILSVSLRTLNADLHTLAAEGHPVVLHGEQVMYEKNASGEQAGAQATSSFTRRLNTRPADKQAIARWAAGLVEDGDTLLMDASTSVYAMASSLANRRGLTVLTNGIEVGRCLARNETNTVILVAGVLHMDGNSVIGPLYEPILRNRHIKTAFVSCKGFSLAAGLTESDVDEAEVKHQMVMLAGKTVALIDSSKFGHVFPAPFARANQITHIFSDTSLDPQWTDLIPKSLIVLTRCE